MFSFSTLGRLDSSEATLQTYQNARSFFNHPPIRVLFYYSRFDFQRPFMWWGYPDKRPLDVNR